MEYGDIAPLIKDAIVYLKRIDTSVNPNACCNAVATGGSGSVPAGLTSVTINGTGVITFADESTFTLITGIPFVQTAPFGSSLPAYRISGAATWYGIK